ncbi:hypothetical protein GW17_00038795, partial [Ensete ventricosum]
RSPIEINPKPRIRKGSNTWYQSSTPWCFTALLQPPITFIQLPKQFPQLLRSSPTPSSSPLLQITPVTPPRIASGSGNLPYRCCNLVILNPKTQKSVTLLHCTNLSPQGYHLYDESFAANFSRILLPYL